MKPLNAGGTFRKIGNQNNDAHTILERRDGLRKVDTGIRIVRRATPDPAMGFSHRVNKPILAKSQL